jgi:hypothetical protein
MDLGCRCGNCSARPRNSEPEHLHRFDFMATPAIPTISRRRDCLVALGAGLLGLVAGLAGRGLFAENRPALAVLLCIVLIAAFGAGAAAALLPLSKFPKAVGLPLAGRTGARTGLMAAFLGAGMLVTGVYLSSGLGVIWIWLPALLSVLPGTLAGILAAGLLASGSKSSEEDAAARMLTEDSGGRGNFWVSLAAGAFRFWQPRCGFHCCADTAAGFTPALNAGGKAAPSRAAGHVCPGGAIV